MQKQDLFFFHSDDGRPGFRQGKQIGFPPDSLDRIKLLLGLSRQVNNCLIEAGLARDQPKSTGLWTTELVCDEATGTMYCARVDVSDMDSISLLEFGPVGRLLQVNVQRPDFQYRSVDVQISDGSCPGNHPA